MNKDTKPTEPATEENLDRAVEQAMVDEFCCAIGGLVLYANFIDTQLTKAVIDVCILEESEMLEHVVAELGARIKISIVEKRFQLVPDGEFKTTVRKWLKCVSKVQTNRNKVAHGVISFDENGGLILRSDQITKVFGKINKNMKPLPHASMNDVKQWVKQARKVHGEGGKIVKDLAERTNKFRESKK